MSKREKLINSKLLFYILSFTWGILWTLIGLLAALMVFIIYPKDSRVTKIIGGRFVICLPHRSFGGISLGIVVIVDEFYKPLVQHELGHTIQHILFGPLFIFLVAIPSGIRYQLFDWLSKRYYKKTGEYLRYDSIWFEGQATKLGESYFKNIL